MQRRPSENDWLLTATRRNPEEWLVVFIYPKLKFQANLAQKACKNSFQTHAAGTHFHRGL
jgi:hypothetical protein